MQSAVSLYFDGAVLAQHCNYLSYRDFGLCCPECSSPVFLASGDTQQPHFRHFKAKDNAPSYCKYRARVHLLERKLSLSFDHKQREKIFRQHFWSILNAAIPHLGLKEIQEEIETNWNRSYLHLAWIKGWQVAAQKGKLKHLVDEYMQAMFSELSESAEKKDSANLIDYYCSLLNQEVQRRTMYAITEFLALKQNQEFLKTLFYYGFFDYIHKFIAPPLHQIQQIYPWILADILGILCVVPWAEAAHGMQTSGSFTPRQEIRVRPGLSTPTAPEAYQLWQSPHSAKSKSKPVGFGLISSTRKSHD